MWYLSLLLLLQQADKPAQAQPKPEPAVKTTTRPAAESKPLVLELVSVYEHRTIDYAEDKVEGQLQIQMRLHGPRIGRAVRVGKLVITEAVDEAGYQLVDPDAIGKRERTNTRPVYDTPQNPLRKGVPMSAAIRAASREATVLKKLRGSVRVVTADQRWNDVEIFNPLQYRGQALEHPLLEKWGFEVRVLGPADAAGVKADDRSIALRMVKGEEQLYNLTFYDAWYKKIQTRSHRAKDKNGKWYTIFQVMGSKLDEDSHMLLEIFPQVEIQDVETEFQNVKLP